MSAGVTPPIFKGFSNMPMVEDFTAFLNADEHATTAMYKTTDVDGIFEDLYVEVSGVESLKPTFLVNVAAVPNIKRDNTLRINNIEYRVAAKQPDGTGMVLIILEAPN
jgi:hypothetical protein